MIDVNKRLVEVETILEKLDTTYKNKIPKELWDFIKQNKDTDYSFYYDEENSLHDFYKMKFDKIAVEPLSGHNENVIEVINQFQTYMVSIKAACKFLLEKVETVKFSL